MDAQCDRVIDYIKTNGSITQFEALNRLGIMRLASRISDLRNKGYQIKKSMVKDKNRYGEKVSYASYSLEEHND